jgi:LmbE family N-acetylglucosaminyl deacetylase
MSDKVAMAISAHPDDIEFCMAGTMLLLSAAGYELHYLTIANGGCGGTKHDAATVARTRAAEAKQSAKILGAIFHPSFCNDLEIVYEVSLLRHLEVSARMIGQGQVGVDKRGAELFSLRFVLVVNVENHGGQ